MYLTLVRNICEANHSFTYWYWTGLLTDLLWSDPDKDVKRWDENDAGISRRFGADIVKEVSNQANLCHRSFKLIFISVLESAQSRFNHSIASGRLF